MENEKQNDWGKFEIFQLIYACNIEFRQHSLSVQNLRIPFCKDE